MSETTPENTSIEESVQDITPDDHAVVSVPGPENASQISVDRAPIHRAALPNNVSPPQILGHGNHHSSIPFSAHHHHRDAQTSGSQPGSLLPNAYRGYDDSFESHLSNQHPIHPHQN